MIGSDQKEPYALAGAGQVRGAFDREHLNDLNTYGMAPLHVALQAGAIGDLARILGMQADPTRRSVTGAHPSLFIQMYLDQNGHRPEARRVAAVMTKKMIFATRVWERKYGKKEPPPVINPPLREGEFRLVRICPQTNYDKKLAAMPTRGYRTRAIAREKGCHNV